MEIHLFQILATFLLFIKTEPNDSFNVTLVGDNTEEYDETTGNVTEEERLSKQQKQCLSRLYRIGEKKSKTNSHFEFLCKCRDVDVMIKGLLVMKNELRNAAKILWK